MSLPGARIVVKAGEKRRRRRWRGKGDRDIVHGKVVGHCCLAGCCWICPRSASLCLTSDKTQLQCGWEGWGLGITCKKLVGLLLQLQIWEVGEKPNPKWWFTWLTSWVSSDIYRDSQLQGQHRSDRKKTIPSINQAHKLGFGFLIIKSVPLHPFSSTGKEAFT